VGDSLFDKARKAAEQLKEKAPDIARQHGDKIDQGIDWVAHEIDERTGRKHGDKVSQARDRAKKAVDDLARPEDPPEDPPRHAPAPRDPP
jgi:hypothetical protein